MLRSRGQSSRCGWRSNASGSTWCSETAGELCSRRRCCSSKSSMPPLQTRMLPTHKVHHQLGSPRRTRPKSRSVAVLMSRVASRCLCTWRRSSSKPSDCC
eukprot:Amastigsp_a853196_6.p4 type:complete len:100 gc:universal Amastigsp_a853196_6:170-469(+)